VGSVRAGHRTGRAVTPVRVLVVDDSVVVRRLVSDALNRDSRIEVVGTAANGRLAQARVEQLAPDLVTMDVEMPEMDGIAAVRALRQAGHRMPIVMFSTLTERGAAATLDALAAGATDYVAKPSGGASVADSLQRVALELVPKVLALAGARSGPSPVRPVPGGPAVRVATGGPLPSHPVRLVVVGSSTGGPEALSRFVGGLAPLPVPAVVVQHMPPVFTRQLAARLDRVGASCVVEAAGDEELRPGTVYVAPGDHHLVVRRRAGGGLVTAVVDTPPVNFCRPSVDVLFSSAVEAVGGEVLGVVLTGMGADGRTGAGQIVAAGGTVLAQDQASSVVWGMPGAVAAAGFAHRVLPLDQIAGVVGGILATGARGTP